MLLYSLIFAVLVSGCASQKHVRTYEDQLPAGQQPALVKPVAFIVIRRIDGKDVYIDPSGGLTAEYELEFKPGEHLLEVQYNDGVLLSHETLTLPMKVESGRKYIIRPSVNGAAWRPNGAQWLPQLLDVTDRPQCWTTSVGTKLFGPKGCDASE